MNKFRASYTILSAWESGRWEDAIDMYFKLGNSYQSEKMRDGKVLHEGWEEEIVATKSLPAVFASMPLSNPEPEIKLVVQVYDWLELVGVIDCYDSPDVHEFKSGVINSQAYARDKQIGMYALLATLSGREAKRLFIHHYNQYDKTSDTSIVWVTPKLLEDTREWIELIAREMHEYFIENDLYERFGNRPAQEPVILADQVVIGEDGEVSVIQN